MPLILDSSSESSSESQPDPLEERRRLHHDADVVIVGAGILGSALAVAFADQGRSVILLERSLSEPDRIVGELLQPGGVIALRKLGLESCLTQIDAVPVHGYCIYKSGNSVQIPYPSGFCGRSFHHGRFIMRLREKAKTAPGVDVIEA